MDDLGQHCFCNELEDEDYDRAYLAAWLCFKHQAHPSLGTLYDAVKYELHHNHMYMRRRREEERRRMAEEQARLAEEAAEEWALHQVRGTEEALQLRHFCESLGLLLWRAGADVPEPFLEAQERDVEFEGLLANSRTSARAQLDPDLEEEQMDDELDGVIYDESDDELTCICVKAQRRAMHGAQRRIRMDKAWIKSESCLLSGRKRQSKEKVQARVPAKPRGQKKALVIGSRTEIAKARQLRRVRHCREASSE